jgi:dipeptidyl aminopeptidase/acylaminoacyl peptidase
VSVSVVTPRPNDGDVNMQRKIAPYGEWRSPITTDMIVAGSLAFSSPLLDNGDVYWLEGRPSEAGRNVIVRARSGVATDVLAPPFNARTRVHEYGGGAYVASRGVIHFSNFEDQGVYHLDPHGTEMPSRLPTASSLRFAAYEPDAYRNRLICIIEDHAVQGQQPVNAIGSIDLSTGSIDTLVAGNDFYASPCLSPNGRMLAWITWNHPNMPWDGCGLWIAEVTTEGALSGHRLIAGSKTESVFQPRWSADGELTFIAELTGWSNIYCARDGRIESLTNKEAEFARPLWNLDASSYAFIGPGTIVCSYLQGGIARLALLNTANKTLNEIACPYTTIEGITAQDGRAVFIGGSPTEATAVVEFNLASRAFNVLKRSNEIEIDRAYVSVPQPIEFPTENGQTAHAFYYPPVSKDFAAPTDELPPIIVKSHGGPTSAASTALKFNYLYWTSRGLGVLDVNYSGSIGYGRVYRKRLNGVWGVADVDDCINAARYLVAQGLGDGGRLIISGGSAGGFTTLSALTFRSLFKAGTSYYGVADVEALARETHKFESHYLENLIGPYPARKDIYVARSPIHFADRISAPLLLLQGQEDKVVPPNQSESMFKAVRDRGLPTAYIAFEGEQHGFRRGETIKRALEAETYFYARVFGYSPADNIEPIHIENL